MPEIEPRKLKVILDLRAWANVRTQKMGWLRIGDVVEIFEVYKGWTQFRPVEGGDDLIPINKDYTQHWIEPNMEDRFEPFVEGSVPEPPPLPDPPRPSSAISLEDGGRALDTLVRFLRQAWERWAA